MKDFDLENFVLLRNPLGGHSSVTVGPRPSAIRTKIVDLGELHLHTRVDQPPISNGSWNFTHHKTSLPPSLATARPTGSDLEYKNLDLEQPLPSEKARIALRRTVFEIFHFENEYLEFFLKFPTLTLDGAGGKAPPAQTDYLITTRSTTLLP
jgi:hypothetical protein